MPLSLRYSLQMLSNDLYAYIGVLRMVLQYPKAIMQCITPPVTVNFDLLP